MRGAISDGRPYRDSDLRKPRNCSPEASRLFDPVARRTHEVAKMHKPVTQGNPVLTASPDGRYLAYTQIDRDGSNVILIENFR